jgi:uncharacterized glyoxalase superfamily protein PhnB
MKALSATVVIHVSDLNRALAYYTAILGFSEDFKLREYAGLTLGDVCIHLSGPTNPGMKKIAGNAHFCIQCDEVDTYFDAISKKGAFISVPLDKRYYGMRDFAVNDHDGNTVVFGRAITDTP